MCFMFIRYFLTIVGRPLRWLSTPRLPCVALLLNLHASRNVRRNTAVIYFQRQFICINNYRPMYGGYVSLLLVVFPFTIYALYSPTVKIIAYNLALWARPTTAAASGWCQPQPWQEGVMPADILPYIMAAVMSYGRVMFWKYLSSLRMWPSASFRFRLKRPFVFSVYRK